MSWLSWLLKIAQQEMKKQGAKQGVKAAAAAKGIEAKQGQPVPVSLMTRTPVINQMINEPIPVATPGAGAQLPETPVIETPAPAIQAAPEPYGSYGLSDIPLQAPRVEGGPGHKKHHAEEIDQEVGFRHPLGGQLVEQQPQKGREQRGDSQKHEAGGGRPSPARERKVPERRQNHHAQKPPEAPHTHQEAGEVEIVPGFGNQGSEQV